MCAMGSDFQFKVECKSKNKYIYKRKNGEYLLSIHTGI